MDTNTGVKITYYGHSCFLLSFNDNFRILIDPYRNREDRLWFKQLMPQVECELCLITHAHFDHDEIHILEETSSILRLPGTYTSESFSVSGYQDIHAGRSGKLNFPNIIFKVEAQGLTFVHWGDNRPNISEFIIEQIANCDILFLPSDDTKHLLKFEEINDLIHKLSPGIVIPMHYFMDSISHEQNSLLPITEWLNTRPETKKQTTSTVTVDNQNIPNSTEIWIMDCLQGEKDV